MSISDGHLAIIGGGAAGLSLCRVLAEDAGGLAITLIEQQRQRQEHSWGFWRHDAAEDAFAMARAHWQRWSIITPEGRADQHAVDHPYACLESKAWLGDCRQRASAAGVRFKTGSVTAALQQGDGFKLETNTGSLEADIVLDSRHGQVPDGTLLQHFIGWEVEAEHDCFDPALATLMDFRCDQSRGIHFLYVLPFSKRRALVESTLFSPAVVENGYYETAIDRYCRETLGSGDYMVLRREQGVIPMGFPAPADARLTGLGGNGGAIRPSSGYAFVFIQKQVAAVARALRAGQMPSETCPHQSADLWMDRVFLKVLKARPRLAPRLFLRMARALSGDDMARFLSGEADWGLRFKVIWAMPKLPFLLALIGPGRRS